MGDHKKSVINKYFTLDCESGDTGTVGNRPRRDGLRHEQHGGARGRCADCGERHLGREGGRHGEEAW